MPPSLPLPDHVTATLTIKAGEPLKCRDSGVVSTISVSIAEGYEVVRAKIKAVVTTSRASAWTDTTVIYYKPTKFATQRDYRELREDDFKESIDAVWHSARRRQAGQANFKLELFVYVDKPKKRPAATLHRATTNRQEAVRPRVLEALQARQIEHGPASLQYATITQARLSDDLPIVIPESATFRQLQYIDRMQEAESTATATAVNFYPVKVKLNNSITVLPMNIAHLREALGLPSYPLCPPYRAPPQVPLSAPPTTDIEDIDHTLSDEDGEDNLNALHEM